MVVNMSQPVFVAQRRDFVSEIEIEVEVEELVAVRALDERAVATDEGRLDVEARGGAQGDAVEAGGGEDDLHAALHRAAHSFRVRVGEAEGAVEERAVEVEGEEAVHGRAYYSGNT